MSPFPLWLLLGGLAPVWQPFSLAAPPGPTFTPAEQAAQRAAGQTVLPLVTAAYRAGAASVRLPPGDYRYGRETWGPHGPTYALQFTDLVRDADHPFTIDATGCTFWFDPGDEQTPTAHFCLGFKRCANVSFVGATLERGTRGHVEGRLTAIDRPGNRLELAVSPGCVVPTTFNGKMEQRVIPFKADGRFCAPLYRLQAGGRHLKYGTPTPGTAPGRIWVPFNDTALLDAATAPGADELGRLEVGDGLSLVYTVCLAVGLIDSSRVSVVDLNCYIAKGGGNETGGGGGHRWLRCYFGPRPGTNQWSGGDGFMFNGTRVGTTLEDCTVCHTTDDIANIHGYWSEVAAVAGTTLTLTKPAREVAAGDRLVLLDKASGAERGRAVVRAVEGARLTLDQPSDGWRDCLVEWLDHECAGWTIQGCDFHDNYQRLMLQSGPGVVRNCTFTRQGSSVEFNSVLPTLEGGVPRDIDIVDCRFLEVNPQPGGAAINCYAQAYERAQAPLLERLRVAGCTFERCSAAVALRGVAGLRLTDNHTGPPEQALRLEDCRDVTLVGNR